MTAPESLNIPPRLLAAQKIWDAAPYNAFTGLARFNGQFFCAFREAAGHLSFDGTIRILASADGESWSSVAVLAVPNADVRDAKLSVTPDNRLLLHGAIRTQNPDMLRSAAWLSRDGRTWTDALPIVDPGIWLWGMTWHKGTAYGMGYGESLGSSVRLYTTTDSLNYLTRVSNVPVPGTPSEHAMAFLEDDTAVCLLRRDGQPRSAMLGTATPPYTQWTWSDLGRYAGGPAMIRIPDGRLVAIVRFIDSRQFQRIGLCWVDANESTMTEFHTLPGDQQTGPPHAMGDWGYPGAVWHEDRLWLSYYSPHEGKTSIYIAQIEFPAA